MESRGKLVFSNVLTYFFTRKKHGSKKTIMFYLVTNLPQSVFPSMHLFKQIKMLYCEVPWRYFSFGIYITHRNLHGNSSYFMLALNFIWIYMAWYSTVFQTTSHYLPQECLIDEDCADGSYCLYQIRTSKCIPCKATDAVSGLNTMYPTRRNKNPNDLMEY